MGGSSLAPEVLTAVLPRSSTGLRVRVLDSTDPAAVRAADGASEPADTLRIIATKSGTTTETLAFLAHFWESEHHRLGRFHGSQVGDGFIAITDPGGSLEAIPHGDLFRETLLNPPDVGGRYSALTYVGLAPGALHGLDIGALLDDARAMLQQCLVDEAGNPGVSLGAAIGALAKAGRDKLTFVIEPDLAPLGAWLEQLIAESTGKSGTGIVPVDGEPLGAPGVYGPDRVFVRLGRPSHTVDLDAVARRAGRGGPSGHRHPAHRRLLGRRRVHALGGGHGDRGRRPGRGPLRRAQRDRVEAEHRGPRSRRTLATAPSPRSRRRLPAACCGCIPTLALTASGSGASAADVLRAHLARAADSGYHAICAYVAATPERTAALRRIQALLRDHTHRATTLGFGPRYLHSTGQLHKGGTPTGCFLQLVAGHTDDLPIPGHHETFRVLIDAQALGDRVSLAAHGLPLLRIHLSDEPDVGLAELETLLAQALS